MAGVACGRYKLLLVWTFPQQTQPWKTREQKLNIVIRVVYGEFLLLLTFLKDLV